MYENDAILSLLTKSHAVVIDAVCGLALTC